MSTLEIGDLHVSVETKEGAKPILRGVDLTVRSGETHAISDICSHGAVSLSDGEVEDCTIECWLHGSRFHLRTGKPTGPPAVRPVPVYPVTVDGERVLVDVDAPL